MDAPGTAPEPVELRDVTPENFDDVIALEVTDDQSDYLNSNVETLAWAYVFPQSHPFVIYAGDKPVGLVAYSYIPTDGRCWINHLMIDKRRQRAGVGRAALEHLLARMVAETGADNIVVAVNPDNSAALRLYEDFGFVDTGRRQEDELILRLEGARESNPPPG